MVVVLVMAFLPLLSEEETDDDALTDDEEKEAETDELLDMVLSAGIDHAAAIRQANPKSTKQYLLLLFGEEDILLVHIKRRRKRKRKRNFLFLIIRLLKYKDINLFLL